MKNCHSLNPQPHSQQVMLRLLVVVGGPWFGIVLKHSKAPHDGTKHARETEEGNEGDDAVEQDVEDLLEHFHNDSPG